MSQPIWKHDDVFNVGDKKIHMYAEHVTLPEDRESLLHWQFNYEKDPVGKVTNIRVEIDIMGSQILGDVEFFDTKDGTTASELLEHGDIRLGGFYNNVVKSADGTVVESCDLKAVSLVLTNGGANPGASVKP